MKYLTILFLIFTISCLFVSQTNGFFGKSDGKTDGKTDKKTDKKTDSKGKCSLYKGRCGGSLSNTCCKVPYKCAKQTKLCGKDKLCCVTEADIQRQKQESGTWLDGRNGK